jgi:hypothetical protein
MHRVFLLSPAHCGGKRARLVLDEHATSDVATRDLATRLRAPRGAAIGDVFSFLSGLYFRGKLAYARHFARAPEGADGVLVITPTRGLVLPESPVTLTALREFAAVDVDPAERRYREPLERGARRLAKRVGTRCEVVLLGSVATGKYLEVLRDVLGRRLHYPAAFVGIGDMSRGGLMLRCVREGRELEYVRAP